MNEFHAIGRLVYDPILEKDKLDNDMCKFTLSIDKNLSTNKKEEAIRENKPTCDFVNFIAYGNQARLLSKHTKKGNRIYSKGRLQIRSFDVEDDKKYIAEVFVSEIEIIDWQKS